MPLYFKGKTFMPLSFKSENHGNIAFGFFNIESDMLLLENYFFFADDFCQWMIELSSEDKLETKTSPRTVYQIRDPQEIGDLMGAIHGVHFSGFIGAIYKQFPFPADPDGFKQNPDGFMTQKVVKDKIVCFAQETVLNIEFKKDENVLIGPYQFSKTVFHELLEYVWQGGYPKWKDNCPPDYVLVMKKQLQNSYNAFFKDAF